IEQITGDIVAFPDDDCWYPSNLLNDVAKFFSNNKEVQGLTCRCTDEYNLNSSGRFDRTSGKLDLINVWQRGISVTIFLSRNLVDLVGGFDEGIGAGSGTIYGSGEETDYLIRSIS